MLLVPLFPAVHAGPLARRWWFFSFLIVFFSLVVSAVAVKGGDKCALGAEPRAAFFDLECVSTTRSAFFAASFGASLTHKFTLPCLSSAVARYGFVKLWISGSVFPYLIYYKKGTAANPQSA